MERSEQINELATALAKAQGSIEDATKDATNPHFKSRYANLSSVREAIRAPLSENGLSYVQLAEAAELGGVAIKTVLMHASGQYIASTLVLPIPQPTSQAYGSAITYARRYGLMAMVGIAASEDDDDGNAASKPTVGRLDVPPLPRPAEPAVSSDAIMMARLVRNCPTIEEIDKLKRTDEFKTWWNGSNKVDREHVTRVGEKHRASLSDGSDYATPFDEPMDAR